MAVVAAERVLRRSLVEPAGLEHESELVERGLGGEFPYFGEIQCGRSLVAAVLAAGAASFVEQRLSVPVHPDETRVAAGDYGAAGMAPGEGVDFDIEFLGGVLFQGDADSVFAYVFLSAFHRVGSHVPEHLESVCGASDEGSEGYGYRQAGHSGAGYAHSHGVLQDVGAEEGLDSLGDFAERLRGPGHAQGHRDGLRAAYRRHDLPLYEGQDLLAFGF